LKANQKKPLKVEDVKLLSDYLKHIDGKSPKFYEVEFNKPGGMMMPILVEITYEDGTVEKVSSSNLEKNNDTARKVYATEKAIKKIQLTLN
jgi:hypothetical protein